MAGSVNSDLVSRRLKDGRVVNIPRNALQTYNRQLKAQRVQNLIGQVTSPFEGVEVLPLTPDPSKLSSSSSSSSEDLSSSQQVQVSSLQQRGPVAQFSPLPDFKEVFLPGSARNLRRYSAPIPFDLSLPEKFSSALPSADTEKKISGPVIVSITGDCLPLLPSQNTSSESFSPAITSKKASLSRRLCCRNTVFEIDFSQMKEYNLIIEDEVHKLIPQDKRKFSGMMPLALQEAVDNLNRERVSKEQWLLFALVIEEYIKEVINNNRFSLSVFMQDLKRQMSSINYGQTGEYRLAHILNKLKNKNSYLYDLLIFLMLSYASLPQREKQERMFRQLPKIMRTNMFVKQLFEKAHLVLLNLKEIQSRAATYKVLKDKIRVFNNTPAK